jgi:hypothetical protein
MIPVTYSHHCGLIPSWSAFSTTGDRRSRTKLRGGSECATAPRLSFRNKYLPTRSIRPAIPITSSLCGSQVFVKRPKWMQIFHHSATCPQVGEEIRQSFRVYRADAGSRYYKRLGICYPMLTCQKVKVRPTAAMQHMRSQGVVVILYIRSQLRSGSGGTENIE